MPHIGPEVDEDRQSPVPGAARSGGDPQGKLLLEHQGERGECLALLQELEEQRSRDLVREVGHQLETSPALSGDRAVIEAHRISEADLKAGRSTELSFQHPHHGRVRLAGDHGGGPAGQGLGKGSQPGPDLQDRVVAPHGGKLDDSAQHIRISDKVLTQALLGSDPVFPKQVFGVIHGRSPNKKSCSCSSSSSIPREFQMLQNPVGPGIER